MVFRKRKTNPAVETGGTKRSLSKRFVVLVILLLLITGAVGVVFYVRAVKHGDKAVYTTDVCAGLYGDISAAIDAKDYKKYKEVTDKVQAIPGFDKDQNCLYPVVDYYSTTGDSVNGRKYYDLLSAAYNKEKGFNGNLAGGMKSLSDLEKQVVFTEKQLEEYKKGPVQNDFKRH